MPDPESRTSKTLRTMAAIGALALVAGCQTTEYSTSDGRPMPPEPRNVAGPSEGAVPNEMLFGVGPKPVDTNGNAYPDTITVEVSLFSPQSTQPYFPEGSIVVDLYAGGTYATPEGAPIARWTLTQDELDQCRGRNRYGLAAYLIQISILDQFSDVMPLTRADLTCSWVSPDQKTIITSKGIRTISLGRN